MFSIHFHSLPNSGEGNGFMSPEFQQSLAGHKLADTPVGNEEKKETIIQKRTFFHIKRKRKKI